MNNQRYKRDLSYLGINNEKHYASNIMNTERQFEQEKYNEFMRNTYKEACINSDILTFETPVFKRDTRAPQDFKGNDKKLEFKALNPTWNDQGNSSSRNFQGNPPPSDFINDLEKELKRCKSDYNIIIQNMTNKIDKLLEDVQKCIDTKDTRASYYINELKKLK